jgi:hypothetical protein
MLILPNGVANSSRGCFAEHWPARGVPNSIMVQKPFGGAQITTAIAQLINAAPELHRKTEATAPGATAVRFSEQGVEV